MLHGVRLMMDGVKGFTIGGDGVEKTKPFRK